MVPQSSLLVALVDVIEKVPGPPVEARDGSRGGRPPIYSDRLFLQALVIMLIIYLASRGGMGDGDVRLAPLLGLHLGYISLAIVPVGLFFGFLIGAVVGVVMLATSKAGRKTVILNAPALAVLSDLPRVGRYVIPGDDLDRPRSDLKRPWAVISRQAGLEGIRLHDLRHSFASVGAGASLGLPIIGKLLGHAQPSTTQRYAHLDSDPLRRASNMIGQQIAAAMGEAESEGEVVPFRIGRSG